MPLFTIDPALCNRDGLCAKTCPASLIRQENPGDIPTLLAGREDHCIRCGHCVAVCPTEALTNHLLPSDGFLELRHKDIATFESTALLLKYRRSCRNFKPEPLGRDELLELFAVADYAPTGHNARSVGFVVVEGQAAMENVRQCVAQWMEIEVAAKTQLSLNMHLAGALGALTRGKDVILRQAPNLIVAHAPAPGSGVTPDVDAVIAVSWLEIAAAAKNFGACWCGYIMLALANHQPLSELLSIPADRRGYAALLLGRPAWRFGCIPPRSNLDVKFYGSQS